MREPYQQYLQISIVHFMAFPKVMAGVGPILETLEILANDAFFTAVEVGPIKDTNVRSRAAALLAQAHMKVGFAAQPIVLSNKLNPNSPDADERNRARHMMYDAVNQAVELGADRMALLSGPTPASGEKEEQITILIDFLNDLCSYAEKQGLAGLTLETFDYDIDKRALIGSNLEAAKVARAVRREHPDFGLMVDLSHLPLQHESINDGLEATREFLVHAHIGNCVLDPNRDSYGDQHPYLGAPGGENDVDEVVEFLEKLFEIGFLGGMSRPFVGFEIKPQAGESSLAVIASAKRVFMEAWARSAPPQRVQGER